MSLALWYKIEVRHSSRPLVHYCYTVTNLTSFGDVTVPLAEIPYVDRPDIAIPSKGKSKGPAESVSLPFKYVRNVADGTPIMPPGMLELLARDADKDIMDLL